MKKLSKLNKMIGDILWSLNRFHYKIEIVPDNPAPEHIKDRIIYIVGNEDYVKWAYLKCPCNCGDVIMLSLVKFKRPSWKITQDKFGRPTIYPSVHKLDDCKSHFWLRHGKVKFV